jgi:hypothetical protein
MKASTSFFKLASLKLLTYSNMLTETLLRLCFSVIGRRCPVASVHSSLAARKMSLKGLSYEIDFENVE